MGWFRGENGGGGVRDRGLGVSGWRGRENRRLGTGKPARVGGRNATRVGARAAGQLLALRDRDGADWLYPLLQLQGGAPPAGLERVLRALLEAKHDGWAALVFFLESELADGERTPLEALRAGNEQAALQAASMYGEQGAE